MSHLQTYRVWRRTTGPYPRVIELGTERYPDRLGPHDVLLKIHAVALNYRDVAMLQEGKYPIPVDDGGISASDCAAEVVSIGSEVDCVAVGDRVAPTIDLANLTGHERSEESIVLGGDGPGVLREYVVFEDKVLVKLPKYLPWEEVSL